MRVFFGFLSLILVMALFGCNRHKAEGENPLLAETWETPFGVPPFDEISTEDFRPALERGMSLHDEQIDAIVSSKETPTFDNVIAAYDGAGRILSRAWRLYYRGASGAWAEVKPRNGYPVAKDTPCTAEFEPVETTALKLEVQLPADNSAGVFEWSVK